MIGTSSTLLPGLAFSNCFLMSARYVSITLMELSVDCLKEIFTVSGSLPDLAATGTERGGGEQGGEEKWNGCGAHGYDLLLADVFVAGLGCTRT